MPTWLITGCSTGFGRGTCPRRPGARLERGHHGAKSWRYRGYRGSPPADVPFAATGREGSEPDRKGRAGDRGTVWRHRRPGEQRRLWLSRRGGGSRGAGYPRLVRNQFFSDSSSSRRPSCLACGLAGPASSSTSRRSPGEWPNLAPAIIPPVNSLWRACPTACARKSPRWGSASWSLNPAVSALISQAAHCTNQPGRSRIMRGPRDCGARRTATPMASNPAIPNGPPMPSSRRRRLTSPRSASFLDGTPVTGSRLS